jgi:hypothetical protein
MERIIGKEESMKKSIRPLVLVCLTGLFLWGALGSVLAQEYTKVRAKIGIQIKSGDQVNQAKARDRLMPRDLIRIYVHPEMSSYVYVVHTDRKSVRLLNMTEQRIQSSTLVLPSSQDSYQVDGQNLVEIFTIICSPTEIKELTTIANTGISIEKWADLEKDLIEKSKIILTQQEEPPFAIAGNVRGVSGPGSGDPFVKQLQISSGKNLLVKKYEFQVKK